MERVEEAPAGFDPGEQVPDEIRAELEAEDAAERGDGSAVSAALAAYRAELQATLEGATGHPDQLARLAGRLGRFGPLEYHGRIPASRRDAVIARFRDDRDDGNDDGGDGTAPQPRPLYRPGVATRG
mgnify:CR=1 FL=1